VLRAGKGAQYPDAPIAPLRGIGPARAWSQVPVAASDELDTRQCCRSTWSAQPSAKSTARFLSNIAIASANELELHLELASALKVLGHPRPGSYQRELKEIRKMLFGFRARILKEPDPP
jgi:hypothetical protein